MRALQYRAQASECLRLAQEIPSPESRAMLIVMAQHWLALAEQADKNDKVELVYEPPVERIIP
jgi:hypothetical protein